MATRKKSVLSADETGGSEEAPTEAGDELTFEAAMTRLNDIVEELEGGDLSLELSLKRFEEGIHLARKSQARLDAAEARVEELLGFDNGGAPIIEEI